MISLSRRPMVAAGLAAMMFLTACALPRSGPNRSEILAGARTDANAHIVGVTDSVAQAARSVETLGFDSSFLNAAATRADRISAGDVLSVTALCGEFEGFWKNTRRASPVGHTKAGRTDA